MSEADELLREASDPTTPGERLRKLAQLDGPAGHAALCNPNLPTDLLQEWLRWNDIEAEEPSRFLSYDQAAWRNPAVPLLLLREPLPGYQNGALRVLAGLTRCGGLSLDEESLEAAVHDWAHQLSQDMIGPLRAQQLEACAFARHLAGLFSLPWPAEP